MWEKPPEKFSLNHNEIHIWFLNIDDFVQNLDFLKDILSEDELIRSQRYKREFLQHNFIVNRGFLRLILSKYLSINSSQINFDYSPKGKPFLATIHNSQIQFNLSHKNQYVVYCVGKINLGVDLEIVQEKITVKDIAKRFFTDDEYNDICRLDDTEQLEYFFQLWTAKEAYLKAIAEGLSGGLDSINLSKKKSEESWKIELVNSSKKEQELWQIKTLKIMGNCLISLAIKNQDKFDIRYYKVNNLF